MSRLYLFDDARARRWSPFALTRPAGELLHGIFLQRERMERFWGLTCAGHLASERLEGFTEDGAPPVVTGPDAVDTSEGCVLVSSRAVPRSLDGAPAIDGPATLVMEGEVVGWVLPPGASVPDVLDPGDAPGTGARVELEGYVPGWPWDLVARNDERLTADIEGLHEHGGSFLLTEVAILGDHPVVLGSGVKVEPGVLLDVREGPVLLGEGVRIQAPARLTGPLFVGRDSTVLGGSVGPASIGPVCKIRGEVEASVVLGYANKAHDGYLGHAYLGRWVNLGAFTTNSDLKNSYSSVRVPVSPEETVDTGLLKVGCFLGDHVKTGIGTLVNTGTVVGAGSNVFGGGMPPTRVPPFSWGSGHDLGAYRIEKFLEVTGTAMARRDVSLDDGTRGLLRRAWEASRPERG